MSSKGLGRMFSVGIAKEAVRGTPEATVGFWIPFSEASVDEKDVKILDEQGYGIIEDSMGMTIVKQWAEGHLKAYVGDKHFPLILLSALGSLSTATHPTETVVFDHTITVAESAQHQSLTMFLDDPIAAVDYKHGLGCLSSVEIKYELGKFVEYSATFKAKKGVSATLTPATVAENKFVSKHLTFKYATNLAGLTAAIPVKVKAFTLKIDKNLEDDDVLGSITPDDFLNKSLSIEGTLDLLWQDETYKTITLAGIAKAFRIDLLNNDVTLGTSANPEIKIDLAKATFKELQRPIKVNDLMMQSLSFKAHYSAADTKMITVVCTNGQASY